MGVGVGRVGWGWRDGEWREGVKGGAEREWSEGVGGGEGEVGGRRWEVGGRRLREVEGGREEGTFKAGEVLDVVVGHTIKWTLFWVASSSYVEISKRNFT